jgi:putative transposase
MPSTHLSLHYHLVFSTKSRIPLIDNVWRPDLHAYLSGIVRGINAFLFQWVVLKTMSIC